MPLPETTHPVGSGRRSRLHVEAVRTAFFLKPRWEGLPSSPWVLALLSALGILVSIAMERVYLPGPAEFDWRAVAGGWMGVAASAWACYLMRPKPRPVPEDGRPGEAAPGAPHLLCLLMAQGLILQLLIGLLLAWLLKAHLQATAAYGLFFWGLMVGWVFLANVLLLARGGERSPPRLAAATLALALAMFVGYAADPGRFWYEAEPASPQAGRRSLQLTQDMMEAQPRLLSRRLSELLVQRHGIPDLYALTFAPYASEDVFRRESDMVAQVLGQRFDAKGRTLQLVNHIDTLETWPWATPLNLQRAIRHIAKLMDTDEDVFFIHLTSHGAADGELASGFWPMAVDTLKPEQLKAWLDEAGVKYRVISVSACYSGSWIEPLSGDNTLVMTAADADHTSYGCGRKSELTFFGRAMYDEQLRSQTLSFEKAHAAARPLIREREEKAGKDDGYSNPQISVGPGIRKRLALLEQRLEQPQRSEPAPVPH